MYDPFAEDRGELLAPVLNGSSGPHSGDITLSLTGQMYVFTDEGWVPIYAV